MSLSRLLLPIVAFVLSAPVLCATPDELDPVFLAGIGAGLTPEGYPTFDNGTGATNATALQSDGKIIAGGNLSRFNNAGALSALKRLNADGTLDASFNSGGAGLTDSQGQPEVDALLVTADDKIYVGGVFTAYNGTARSGLLRLNADGTLDESFNTAGVTGLGAYGVRYVNAMALLPDGKLVVAGGFYRVNGVVRPAIARLNADGTLDATFTPPGTYDSSTGITALGLQPDGRIVVGGSRYNAATLTNEMLLQRLEPDGTLDASFGVGWANTAGDVDSILVLPSGTILISGNTSLPGTNTPANLLALKPDGAVDAVFTAQFGTGPNGWAGGDLALQPDGKILVGGIFTQWNGQPRASVVRLEADGTLDATFAPAPYLPSTGAGYMTHVYSFAVQPDGRIVIGGWFGAVDDPERPIYNLARYNGDFTNGPGVLRLTAQAYVTTELAGTVQIGVSRFGGLTGAASVSYTTADGTATAGADYTTVSGTLNWAAGEGGVKLINVPILADAAEEAGESFSVTLSGATGATLGSPATAPVLVRDEDSPPAILVPPAGVTLNQGYAFMLSVAFDSVLPATIQWQRDSGGGFQDVPGATGAVYAVGFASASAHAGSYRAIVTNAHGSATSAASSVVVEVPAGSVMLEWNTALTASLFGAAFDPAGRIVAFGNARGFRVNADGSVDQAFAPTVNQAPLAVLALPDGRTLIGGGFTTVNGTARNYIALLQTDGSLDASLAINPPAAVTALAAGAGYQLYIGIGGGTGLVRYSAAGTLDAGFNAAGIGTGGTNAYVWAVRELADGRVLVSHQTQSGFSLTYRLTRLAANGTTDATFNVPALNWNVTAMEVLPDGRIAIAGRFSTIGGAPANRLAILKADGSVDASFDASIGVNGPVLGLRYLNGRLLAWGEFTTAGGAAQRGIARFNLDGTVDPTFVVGAGANGDVNSVLVTPTGELFLAGEFTTFAGVTRNYGALLVSGPGAVGFAPHAVTTYEDAGTIQLAVHRYGDATGGASIDFATADGTALAGTDYVATSGTLTWAAGDSADKLITVTLTNNAAAQALRAFTVNLSAPTGNVRPTVAATVSIVDDDSLPVVTSPPAGQTVNQGVNVTFTAAVTSYPAATYQWTFNGADLADGAGVSGTTTTTLTLTAVGGARAGVYRLRATNVNGAVLSAAADLVVNLVPTFTDDTWPLNLAVNGRVSAIVPLLDGGAYVAGQFTNFAGVAGRNYLVRISATGVVDATFNPAPNAAVTALRLAGDRLYVLGSFTTIGGGAAVNNFAAIDAATGARLAGFMTAIGTGANSTVRALDVFPDGDLLLGGDFTSYNGNTSHSYLARLNPDGSLHTPFSTLGVSGSFNVVTAVATGPDGRFVAGGTLTYGAGSRLIRFDGAGGRDATFVPSGAGSSTTFTRLRILADGRVMASGSALPPSNRTLTRLAAADGAWSSAEFFGATSGSMNDFDVQNNGSTIAAGNFAFVRSPAGNGNVNHISLFGPTGAYDGTWPTGTGLDNTAYAVALAENGRIWVGGDFTAYNGVAVQRLIRLNGTAIPLAVTLQPVAVEALPAATVTFTARATGTSTIAYVWRRNGIDLADGGKISGANTSTLTLTGVDVADEGLYSLHVANLAGTADSTAAELVVLGAPEVLTQPAATLTNYLNRSLTLAVTTRGVPPLTYQWRRNGVDLADGAGVSGATTATLTIASLTAGNAGTYDVVITNGSGSVTTAATELTVVPHPQDRVTAFTGVKTSASGIVYAILPLADGGALVGGQFNNLTGASSTVTGIRIGRVLPDGTVQALPFTLNGNVRAFHRQTDGRILVGGEFTLVTPTGGSTLTRNRVLRLNADLTLDPTFDAGTGPVSTASPTIYSLLTDDLGRIYVAGVFDSWTGQPDTAFVARLLPNGAVDTSFAAKLSSYVYALRRDAAGRVYVGGAFTNYQGGSYLARLLDNGSRDATYAAAPAGVVFDFLLLADGKAVTAQQSLGVRRYLDTGAADGTFAAVTVNSVQSVSLQPDGAILAGGSFTTYGTASRGGLARLSAAGNLDPVLAPGSISGGLNVVRADGYGRIWAGGSFTVFDGIFGPVSLVVMNGDAVNLGFVQPPAPVAVALGGTANFSAVVTGTPAISCQWTRNGVNLADGGRISGATTENLAITGVTGGDAGAYALVISNATGSRTSPDAALVPLGVPEVLLAPAAASVDVGASATFTVFARGAGNLAYEWRRGGTVLVDGTGIAGATTPFLTLTNLALADAGMISVRITGDAGFTTTPPVQLTVTLAPAGRAVSVALPTFNNAVYAVLPLADGSFLAGGLFTSVTWTGGSAALNRFAHIKADGTADLTFPTFNGAVYAIARGPDGKLYVGGQFTTVTPAGGSAVTRNRIVRLLANGAIDPTFDPGTGAASTVKRIGFDAQGRLMLAGEFGSYGGQPASGYIVRVTDTGALDATFVPHGTSFVYDFICLPDGRIWVAHGGNWEGQFYLVLVGADGTRDPGYTYTGGILPVSLIPQADGSVINVGSYSPFLHKVDLTGARDTNFPATDIYHTGPNAAPNRAVADATGRLYIAGGFTAYGGTASNLNGLLRVAPDGAFDATFSAAAGLSGAVQDMAVDATGRLWLAGTFTTYGGSTVGRVLVLNGGDAEVSTGPSDPYATWAAGYGLTAGVDGPGDDPDGDGATNLLEYAIGLNPSVADPEGMPSVLMVGNSLTFVYERARTDVTYSVETTTDLTNSASWTAAGVNQGTPDVDGVTVASVPMDVPARFLRLKVVR